jgi:hypothetical protein
VRVWLALVLFGAASVAEAQDCPDPPPDAPLEATPAAGAPSVTRDTFVRVRYAPGYFEPGGPGERPSTLLHLGRCGPCGSLCSIEDAEPVPGLIQVHGDDLVYLPDDLLEASSQYVALATGVDGTLEIPFCTNTRTDSAAPTLGAISRQTPVRVGPTCGLPDGGYRVGLYFEPATDDGPPGSIEYLLYLTRGVGVEEPRLVARSWNYPAETITMSLLLEPELGETPVCVQLVAVDGVGNATVNEEPHCFDPITRTWFYGGCTATPHAGRGSLTAIALVALAVTLAKRRSRR